MVSGSIGNLWGESEFLTGLREDIASGSLLSLGWTIYHGRTGCEEVPQELIFLAKDIETRWAGLEVQYGEGALLVEESPAIQIAKRVVGGRFAQKPERLSNAAKLRERMGPYSWSREHQLVHLAEELGYSTLGP
jgi:hypothetical protein